MKPVILFILLFYSGAHCQHLDIFQFVPKDVLRNNNIQKIRIYAELDEERVLTSKLFLNSHGGLDSVFLFSPYDTTHVSVLEMHFYDSIGQEVRTFFENEMVVDFSEEVPVMEMFRSNAVFTYAHGNLISKKISNPETFGYDSVAYFYVGKQLAKKVYVNTPNRETIRIINYQYSPTGKLITEMWEEKGRITYVETSSYDKYGNLVRVYMNNIGVLRENVFTDNCYKYDEKGRQIEWSRLDENSKMPMVYKYFYDAADLLVKYTSPFGIRIITYDKF